MSSASTIADVVDAFNRHGKFAARAVEQDLAIEIRHVDTGELATTLWLPESESFEPEWVWLVFGGVMSLKRSVKSGRGRHRRRITPAEVVASVAESVLKMAAAR